MKGVTDLKIPFEKYQKKYLMLFIMGVSLALISGCGVPMQESREASLKSSTRDDRIGHSMITIKNEEREILMELNDSKAASSLLEQLPLEVAIFDRSNFAKAMNVPRNLFTDDPHTQEYELGNLIYWDNGPELAIIYTNRYEKTRSFQSYHWVK